MNSVEDKVDKVDTYQIDTYNTTNTINLFQKGSNTKMSVYYTFMELNDKRPKNLTKAKVLQCLALRFTLK